MVVDCYLRNGIVYLPTCSRVDNSFYRITEPVAVVPVTDSEGLQNAFREAIARGNPPLLNPGDPNLWRPVILKYAG